MMLFDRVVENLHKAALADVSWASAAAQINELVRTVGHSLTYAEMRSGGRPIIHDTRCFVGRKRRSDIVQSYFRDYYSRDEAVPRLYGLRRGDLVSKSDLYTDRERKTSAAYNEYLRINRTQNGLVAAVDALESDGIVLCFADSAERGVWGTDQIRNIKGLLPHIRQFARVRRALADANALGASLADLLDNRRLGLIQLDRCGRILEANDRARDILLKRDALREKGGTLGAWNLEEDAELQRVLAQTLAPDGPHGAGDVIRITRRNAAAPLILEIQPMRHLNGFGGTRELGALVLVVDPAARPRVEPELVTRCLGLTPRESRVVVAVAGGQSVGGIADELGCAESTVRTHVKRVYRKLGISKQTELVRRVLSLEVVA